MSGVCDRVNCPVLLAGPGSPRVYLVRLHPPAADGHVKVLKTPGLPELGSENPDLPRLLCVERQVRLVCGALYEITAIYAPKAEAAEHRTMEFDSPLDGGIRSYVEILVSAGIETYESCQGGDGHAFAEPTVRFHGGSSAGFHALAIAIQHALPVSELHRVWTLIDGEPPGPTWELTFSRQGDTAEEPQS